MVVKLLKHTHTHTHIQRVCVSRHTDHTPDRRMEIVTVPRIVSAITSLHALGRELQSMTKRGRGDNGDMNTARTTVRARRTKELAFAYCSFTFEVLM